MPKRLGHVMAEGVKDARKVEWIVLELYGFGFLTWISDTNYYII